MKLLKPSHSPAVAAAYAAAAAAAGASLAAVIGVGQGVGAVVGGMAVLAALMQRWSSGLGGQIAGVSGRIREATALVSLESGARLGGRIVPWSGWSLTPDVILRLVSLMAYRRFATVIECGAGMSTVFLGHQARSGGRGHVWTLEHDPQWAATIQALVDDHGLSDWVSIVVAPLTELACDDRTFRWYDLRQMEQVLALRDVDVLLVDGPPGFSGPEARYPALPTLDPCLAPDAFVFLDDSHRPDERRIVERWCEGGRWEATRLQSRHGLTQLTRRGHATHASLPMSASEA